MVWNQSHLLPHCKVLNLTPRWVGQMTDSQLARVLVWQDAVTWALISSTVLQNNRITQVKHKSIVNLPHFTLQELSHIQLKSSSAISKNMRLCQGWTQEQRFSFSPQLVHVHKCTHKPALMLTTRPSEWAEDWLRTKRMWWDKVMNNNELNSYSQSLPLETATEST